MTLQPLATGVAWAVKSSVLCTILHISTVGLYRRAQGRVKMAPLPAARLERDLIAASAAKVRRRQFGSEAGPTSAASYSCTPIGVHGLASFGSAQHLPRCRHAARSTGS
jgi:hypothetical protein